MTVIFVFVNAVATRERFYLSPIRSGSLNVDLHSIDKRRQQLLNFDQATSYSKHKDSLQRELETFLSRLPGRVSLATATPPEIYVVFVSLRIRVVELRSTITVVNLLANRVDTLVVAPSGYPIIQ